MADPNALVIGALLHDIGKFAFRASQDFVGHTTYGDRFVSEYLGGFRCLQPLQEDIRRLVAQHHDGDAADPFLREADHLAAAERQKDASRQTRRSLVSVLASVDIGKAEPNAEVYRYRPGAIDYADPFPEHLAGQTVEEWKPDEGQMVDEHKKAWEAFCADVALLPDTQVEAWIESYLSLAHKHLSRVASAAYYSHPDITLYDHMRSVAAVAVCLQGAVGQDDPFLLIQGDISGIQRFLYRLASPEEEGGTKNMAKRLRGRSFFVGLLAESVALYHLRRLGLPPTNLLYSSGGHFQILAPNTAEIRTALKDIERETNKWLWDSLRGEIGLVCVAVPGTREEVKNFASWREAVGAELGRAKLKKFGAILDDGLFDTAGYSESMDVCPVCQADFAKGSGRVCSACDEHVEIGRRIVQAQYLVRLEGKELDLPQGSIMGFEQLGIYWYIAADRVQASRLVERMGTATRIRVERLNDTDFLDAEGKALAGRLACPLSYGFRPLGQYAPCDEDGPLDFEALSYKGSESYPLLGIVRLDVDSLGTVFSVGKAERRSLARLATMSRELEVFFLGYVNHLARRHDMYITYSGGDDVFAVGSWTRALDFARALRRDFARFACGNANLTLSAGLLFCKADFPIGRAAQVAGELENRAKGGDKNAVAVFDEVVSWDRLEELVGFGETLLDLVQSGKLPRSFVHRLLGLRSERTQDGTINMAQFVRNRVRLKYMVSRRGATSRDIDAHLRGEKKDLSVGALGRLVTEPELMEQITVPASYVLYRTRNLKQED